MHCVTSLLLVPGVFAPSHDCIAAQQAVTALCRHACGTWHSILHSTLSGIKILASACIVVLIILHILCQLLRIAYALQVGKTEVDLSDVFANKHEEISAPLYTRVGPVLPRHPFYCFAKIHRLSIANAALLSMLQTSCNPRYAE